MTQGESDAPEFDPEEPFALQLEWLANRYNPGHFLGGTICPELRVSSLGWHAKRVAAAMAFISGCATLGLSLAVTVVGRIPPDPWSLSFGGLSVVAGVKIWKTVREIPPWPEATNPEEGRKLLRAVALAGLGAGVVAAGSLLALCGVSVAMAVSRGDALIGAIIGVVLASFAATRMCRRRTRG